MRADQIVSEVSMRPTRIARAATQINPTVGIEFELLVPATDVVTEPEPDYSSDRNVQSIDDIIGFFDAETSTRDLIRLENKLRSAYLDYADEYATEQWNTADEEDVVRTYAYDKFKNRVSNEELQEIIDSMLSEKFDNAHYRDAHGEYVQNVKNYNLPLEKEFLQDEYGIVYMSDVPTTFDYISWPYYTGGVVDEDEIQQKTYEAARDDLDRYLDGPVTVGRRNGAVSDQFVIMPDGSLSSDDPGYVGMEIVSPPTDVQTMRKAIDDIKRWAKWTGAFTNETCGLHMNVSVPNYDRTTLDYTKLILLVGDEYVLKQFDRLSNEYCASTLLRLQQHIKRSEVADVNRLLVELQKNLDAAASRAFYDLNRGRPSINVRGDGDDWVEFRGPGGDWLKYSTDQLMNTLNRFVISLDAAMDPQKYRKDYLKKLYARLMSKFPQNATVIDEFVRYKEHVEAYANAKPEEKPLQSPPDFSATKQRAKFHQQNKAMDRKFSDGKKYLWSVSVRGRVSVVNVYADSELEAVRAALANKAKWPMWSDYAVLRPLGGDMSKITQDNYQQYFDVNLIRQVEQKPQLREAEEGTREAKKIDREFKKMGYKKLGSGAEAAVWAKDDDSVVKVIMPESGADMDSAAKTFYKFYEFCQQNTDQSNLPRFVQITKDNHHVTFEVNDRQFIMIGIERLRPLKEGSFSQAMIWMMSDLVTKNKTWTEAYKDMLDPKTWKHWDPPPSAAQIIKKLKNIDGMTFVKFDVLYTLMLLLYKKGKINKLGWDLHTENVMERKDGTLVIIDPWFSTELG